MRRLLFIFFFLISSMGLHATTWYATSSSVNVNAASLWVPTSTGTCTGSGTALSWGGQSNGDTFDANGCTALSINVDMGGASVQSTIQNTTHAGGFTLTTANLATIGTLHTNVIAGTVTALALSGSTGCGTISGNITGGSASGILGVTDTHTSCTVTVIGNITGGSVSAANGWTFSGSSGSVALTGNASAGSAAIGLNLSNAGTATVNGNCVGSNTVATYGCNSSAGAITVNGNIINGTRGTGASGAIYFTPAATNYIISPANSSYTLGTINGNATVMPTNPGAGRVQSGIAYGPYTGTYSSGGGSVCSTGGW